MRLSPMGRIYHLLEVDKSALSLSIFLLTRVVFVFTYSYLCSSVVHSRNIAQRSPSLMRGTRGCLHPHHESIQ